MSASSAVLLAILLLKRLILATIFVGGAHPPSSREADKTHGMFLIS
jgi:hypothetical protein